MLGALGPIYYGAHKSLRTPKSTRELRKKNKRAKDSEEEDSEDDDDDGLRVGDKVTSGDAWLFPVFGSMVLFGMYLIFRYLNKEYINLLLSFYFGLLGIFALSNGLIGISRSILGRSAFKKLEKFKVNISKAGDELLALKFTYLELALVGLSVLLTTAYILTRNWIVSNMLALSLSLNAITLMELDSFLTGSIMLGGLFLYDIFWVFGTEVMVSVARNFDAPIKIVWPKNILVGLAALLQHGPRSKAFMDVNWQFTMLGLGDIVIPGIFIALALRYDQHVASSKNPSTSFTRHYTAFPKPYFTATFIAYIVGLGMTMGVMHVFKAAQPALLYLSPACVAAVAIQSSLRGEWKDVWSWKDAEEEEEEEKKKKEGNEKKEKKARRSSSVKSAKTSTNSSSKEWADEVEDAATPGRRSTRRRKASVRAREAEL